MIVVIVCTHSSEYKTQFLTYGSYCHGCIKESIKKLMNDVLAPSSSVENDKNIFEKSFSSPLKEAREHFEKEYLTTQLKKNHGNISKTADFIGMERSALHRKLKTLGIKGVN